MKTQALRKLLLAVVLFFAVSLSASAQRSAQVTQVKMASDDTQIYYYVDFTAYNCLNCEVQVVICFYDCNNNPLKDFNGQYKSANGKVAVQSVVTPGYQNTDFTEVEVAIPYSELHLARGTHDINYMVFMCCNGQLISSTDDFYSMQVTI